MPSKSPNKFAHIVYRTYQFEKMIHWYQTVLGAKVQHKDPVIAFVTYDEEHHRVAFLNMSVFEIGHSGYLQFCIWFRVRGLIFLMSRP